jgi:hypothetical protein
MPIVVFLLDKLVFSVTLKVIIAFPLLYVNLGELIQDCASSGIANTTSLALILFELNPLIVNVL